MVRKDKEMIVYTPSKVFEAFMLSGASCMIFLRDDRELRYKGTFKASPLQAIDQAHYQTFSEPVRTLAVVSVNSFMLFCLSHRLSLTQFYLNFRTSGR